MAANSANRYATETASVVHFGASREDTTNFMQQEKRQWLGEAHKVLYELYALQHGWPIRTCVAKIIELEINSQEVATTPPSACIETATSPSEALNCLRVDCITSNQPSDPGENPGLTGVSHPRPQDCGVSNVVNHRQPRNVSSSPVKGRIINGKQSRKGAWPWQVSLQLLHPKFGFIGHWCGGVLIRSQWVATAAHCFHNDLFNLPWAFLWTVVLGEWDREVEEETEDRIPAERIFMHERFNHYQNDIALVKLSRAADISGGHVKTVCLPQQSTSLSSFITCMVTGWGHASPRGSLTTTLLQARLPIHDSAVCVSKYKGLAAILPGHLCAGHLDGTTGTCVGDSGGPLQCSMEDGHWYLAGITSFGSGCAKPGYPDVYTRLSFYVPWIEGKIKMWEI
ncbi:chymotrypsin-like elastase family member 2A [Anabrus simplex]|uniref:chymotrypsin-like elastase family member 2A n=1 Tax=Anabrus simplex TaxID=316456 RepID=UPI0035A341D0